MEEAEALCADSVFSALLDRVIVPRLLKSVSEVSSFLDELSCCNCLAREAATAFACWALASEVRVSLDWPRQEKISELKKNKNNNNHTICSFLS